MLAFIQAAAQLPPPAALPVGSADTVSPAQAAGQIQSGTLFLDKNLELTAILLIFALIALVLLYGMVRHERAGKFEFRIFVITILIFGSLLVVAAGFSDVQITPLIGFFGTIAGYILGRGDRPSAHPNAKHQSANGPNDND
jgi:hypothetical protein